VENKTAYAPKLRSGLEQFGDDEAARLNKRHRTPIASFSREGVLGQHPARTTPSGAGALMDQAAWD
jgi:hypothetical protein